MRGAAVKSYIYFLYKFIESVRIQDRDVCGIRRLCSGQCAQPFGDTMRVTNLDHVLYCGLLLRSDRGGKGPFVGNLTRCRFIRNYCAAGVR